MAKVLSGSPSIDSIQIHQLFKEFGSEELKKSMNRREGDYRQMLFSIEQE